MVIVTHQREKCIGCNYCVEVAPHLWRMSKKDGKVTLVGGVEKRGFYTLRAPDYELDTLRASARLCPVKIIDVR